MELEMKLRVHFLSFLPSFLSYLSSLVHLQFGMSMSLRALQRVNFMAATQAARRSFHTQVYIKKKEEVFFFFQRV